MNPPALIKSGQPIRCNDQIVNDSELGRYDKGLQEGELPLPGLEGLSDFDQDAEKEGDDSDSSSLHLALSQIARNERRAAKGKTKKGWYHFLETKTTISVITRRNF